MIVSILMALVVGSEGSDARGNGQGATELFFSRRKSRFAKTDLYSLWYDFYFYNYFGSDCTPDLIT